MSEKKNRRRRAKSVVAWALAWKVGPVAIATIRLHRTDCLRYFRTTALEYKRLMRVVKIRITEITK